MRRFIFSISIAIPILSLGCVYAATTATTATTAKTVTTKVVANKIDTAVWIPYWRKDEGASTTLVHLDSLTQISPFAFELYPDGTIDDAPSMDEEPWLTLIAEAKKKKIKIYPSILSYPKTDQEKQGIYLLLSNKKKRQAHVKDIVALVKDGKFDGIDIDYEAKIAEIKPYFSAFLTELGIALRKEKKQLICTVEPRTPPESKFATTSKVVLSQVEYANDYKIIGKVCDQVRVMTYDQSGDDLQLVYQNKNAGNIYKPVADIDWVEKVATLMLRDIPAKKILLGAATYGYKYEMIPATATTSASYPRIGSMNFNYADELAKSIGAIPMRNIAGELSFTYSTTTDIYGGYMGGEKQYLVWYSDAQAIADKIRLARLYQLAGVAVFKIDGGNDPALWQVLGK